MRLCWEWFLPRGDDAVITSLSHRSPSHGEGCSGDEIEFPNYNANLGNGVQIILCYTWGRARDGHYLNDYSFQQEFQSGERGMEHTDLNKGEIVPIWMDTDYCGDGKRVDYLEDCEPSDAGCTDACQCKDGWANEGASGGCTKCVAGKYAALGALHSAYVCSNCPAGKSTNGADKQSSCSACGAGRYSLSASPTCTNCPAGRATSSSTQADSCPLCTAGRYASGQGWHSW